MAKKKKKSKKQTPLRNSSRPIRKLRGGRGPAAVVLLVLILIECGGLYLFFKEYHVKKKWSLASGVITECEEVKEVTGIAVAVDFQYEYEIQGQKYRSKKVALQELYLMNLNELKEYLPEAQVGKTVEVRYNPENPTESILVFFYSWDMILTSILIPPGLVLIALLLLDPGIFLFWRRFKKNKATSF